MKSNLPSFNNCNILIIGLGYVGLPLAVEFAKTKVCKRTGSKVSRKVIGYDINSQRIEELKKGIDNTNELSNEEISYLNSIKLISDINDFKDIEDVDVYIITVPTPINSLKLPNLNPLIEASIFVGKLIKETFSKENYLRSNLKPIIIFESTVYPGATEEVCVPKIEEYSNKLFNKDFYCGYSPERINPGDKNHRLSSIKKITSGSSKESAIWIDNLYGSIIEAGTFLTKNIKVAEAAKVIENTQRDLNIALINELTTIFNRIGVDTLNVLEAAGTKWNFLPFKPGLVGGHCIGVDPYYLTYKAKQVGCNPELVLAGRKINDEMGNWITTQIIKEMALRGHKISGSRVLILGITFKENCPDIRNTRIIELKKALDSYSLESIIYDPWADEEQVLNLYGIKIEKSLKQLKDFSVVISAVSHKEFITLNINDWRKFGNKETIFFDFKGIMPKEINPLRI